ncbi:MAG: NAD(P)-binding protein [Polyangiaceae bacterium]|nr:NAD(P)-binding protein [Polyangiaceae bacterium]
MAQERESRQNAQGVVDCLIIGAGFGGLGAAVGLLGSGASVVLCEALRYPGGCASSFTRGGQRYESGATLFSGFGPGQLFDDWSRQLELGVEFQALDPLIELRTPELVLPVWRDRARFVETLCALEPRFASSLQRFFAEQKTIADTLWQLFDTPELLPPFRSSSLWQHSLRTPSYLKLLPLIGQPLGRYIERHGLSECQALRTYLNAVCQITVQTAADEAEAPFALAALDYCFRGTGHVAGGIGSFASAVTDAISRRGTDVRFSNRVQRIAREPLGDFRVETRHGTWRARSVIANLLPQDLARLLGYADAELRELSAQVESGWGAVMSYLTLDATKLSEKAAFHLQLVADTEQEFSCGNHVFCSVSDAREHSDGVASGSKQRSATLSTHVKLAWLRSLSESERADTVRAIQQAMRRTLELRAPEVAGAALHWMPASPRTFERFTGRFGGYVGGVPRRAGLANYRRLGPLRVEPGLYLVGDSVFPGQSILAAALGGLRTAEAICAKELGIGIGKRRLSAQHADPHVSPPARSRGAPTR